MGHFPTWNITYFKFLGVFQHKKVKFSAKNDSYSGNRHIYVGFQHICTHLIGFYGNIPRWGLSQLGISLVSSDLVCFSIN